MSARRQIAAPFVAAPPTGTRVRTRLRVAGADAAVLCEVGEYLGSLASADLATRCAEGNLDAAGRARSRQARKWSLTAKSSSRWAGAITRTSEDAYQLAQRNLLAERRSLQARINRIEARLGAPVGQRAGRVRGYGTRAERHAKTVRARALRARLTGVQQRLDTGRVSVCRGGKALLRKRHNLAAAGLAGARWREQWTAARLFLTADGEKDKTWGNETIRWNPDQRWLEIKLPAPLAHLANQPHGRYRLCCRVGFSYRGEDVAAQAATGAVRYDISFDCERGRWYLDASWKAHVIDPVTLAQARAAKVVAVDVNAAHLAVAVLDPDGNRIGVPRTIGLPLAGLPSSTRDGHLRAAISAILGLARMHAARAVVVEDLDFADAREQGREHTGNRPSTGRRGRSFRHQVTGIPTARFRERLTHMACNAGVAVIAVDPAYTSRWGAQHWLALMRHHHPTLTGHHAAALVIGRRGLGLRARRATSGNRPAPEDAARSTQTRRETHPMIEATTRRPATRTDPRQPANAKTRRPRKTIAGDQAAQDRSGPPTRQDSLLLGD